jgi:hypothetical protein
MFNELRCGVVVHFVDVDGIVAHHRLIFYLFIITGICNKFKVFMID